MSSEQALPDPGPDAAGADWLNYHGWLASIADDEPPDPEADSWDWQETLPPGEASAPAAGLSFRGALDEAVPCAALAMMAEDLAGDGDVYAGAGEDELAGAVALWDRVQAYATARKLSAVAAFIGVRPEPGGELAESGGLPAVWDDFAADELALVLAESRDGAEKLLEFSHALRVKLPGTLAALRAGEIREAKAWIMACAARALDPAEARAAEELVLGRAGRLTPGGLRAAIARAVMEVAPGKARKRREDAARDVRVERWAEDSGNAALAGRELPPAAVLAADERITAWAKELKRGGLKGTMDELRARAYLDILLGQDSRSGVSPVAASLPDAASPPGAPVPPDQGPLAGLIPAAFAARINLTVTLPTLLGLADRPGELSGLGPIDPALARDLARSAARSPESAWCITVTDGQGHATGHGCARPEPKKPAANRAKPPPDTHDPPGSHDPPDTHDPPGSHDPPGRTAATANTGFSCTAAGDDGPPGGYRSWRLTTGVPGQRALLISVDPLPAGTCDHRFQAAGHNPGRKLRHLTGIRHATCTSPICRRPAKQCDFEHNIPFEAGGRTCLCNGGPKCRHDHRLKQDPRWNAEQPTPALIRWTTPTGRQFSTEPTRYPI